MRWLPETTPNSDPEREIQRDQLDEYRGFLMRAAERIGGSALEQECFTMLHEDGYSSREVINHLESIYPAAFSVVLAVQQEHEENLVRFDEHEPHIKKAFIKRFGAAVMRDLRQHKNHHDYDI